MFWLAVATLLIFTLLGIDLVRGNRSIPWLRSFSPEPSAALPRVSVIAAARNEERNLREALESLLSLNYPQLELILVDDRSEDATGAILEELAKADQRLKVIHIATLPDRWLGKNHALWTGAARANGELLLFTDADIFMEPSTLTRAVHFFEQEQLDHLVVTPVMRMPSLLLNMFGAAFILFFGLYTRPWKARDPNSSHHVGIGAFNLVRAATYGRVGGHRTIRLRPDDDLKLGKILKKGGGRAEVVYGGGLIEVEWYGSLGELIKGLEKNAFAGTDYNIALVLLGSIFHLTCSVWPYFALFFTSGATCWVYGGVVGLITLLFMDSARFHRANPVHAVGFPLCAALFVYILLRTMVLNLVQGGINWRGTFYPLKALKANKV